MLNLNTQFNRRNYLIVSLFITSLLIICTNAVAQQQVSSDDIQLAVTPERCVSLHKGQLCYLEVTFDWQHPESNDYCLFNVNLETELKCWQNAKQGEYSFDFQATETTYFALRRKNDAADIKSAQVIVASVYTSTKKQKSTWRLF